MDPQWNKTPQQIKNLRFINKAFIFYKIRYDNADVRIFLWALYICMHKKLNSNSVYIYLKNKSDKKQ